MLRESTFDTGTVVLNVAESAGLGPPLILLHGGSARWQGWWPMLEALAANHHLVALDLRGHGRSGHLPGAYRVQDYADDLIAVLERRIAKPAVVFGHSLGGIVAVMAAGQRPDLFAGLIIGDAPLSAESWYAVLSTHFDRVRAWRDLAAARLPFNRLVEALKESPIELPGQPETLPARVVLGEDSGWFEWMATNMSQFDPSHLTILLDDYARAAEGYDMERLLPHIDAPVLIVQSDPARGAALSDDEVDRALRLLPQAEHVRMDGMGHSFHDPAHVEAVLNAVLPFLKRIAPFQKGSRTTSILIA